MEGFLLGLFTGQGCLVGCSTLLIPYMLKEGRGMSIFYFLGGRLISYMLLAFLAILFHNFLSAQRNLFLACSSIGLSSVLLFRSRAHNNKKVCLGNIIEARASKPLLLGFFTSLNFCPSLILAFTSAAKKESIFETLVFFISFFIATSLYFLPLSFIIKLKKFSFMEHIGKISSYLVGGIYLLIGLYQLYQIFI